MSPAQFQAVFMQLNAMGCSLWKQRVVPAAVPGHIPLAWYAGDDYMPPNETTTQFPNYVPPPPYTAEAQNGHVTLQRGLSTNSTSDPPTRTTMESITGERQEGMGRERSVHTVAMETLQNQDTGQQRTVEPRPLNSLPLSQLPEPLEQSPAVSQQPRPLNSSPLPRSVEPFQPCPLDLSQPPGFFRPHPPESLQPQLPSVEPRPPQSLRPRKPPDSLGSHQPKSLQPRRPLKFKQEQPQPHLNDLNSIHEPTPTDRHSHVRASSLPLISRQPTNDLSQEQPRPQQPLPYSNSLQDLHNSTSVPPLANAMHRLADLPELARHVPQLPPLLGIHSMQYGTASMSLTHNNLKHYHHKQSRKRKRRKKWKLSEDETVYTGRVHSSIDAHSSTDANREQESTSNKGFDSNGKRDGSTTYHIDRPGQIHLPELLT